MADVHDKETRHYNMSQIKGKDTKPEILVRKFLFAKGYRYRLYDKKLYGKPDLVFSKYNKVIEMNWKNENGEKVFLIVFSRNDWHAHKLKMVIETLELLENKIQSSTLK
jgi:DNA mismatch endonuclease (patch repair protein)